MLVPLLALGVMTGAFDAARSITALAPTLVGLIETPELSTPVISPDGRFVVYRRAAASVARNDEDISWWVAPVTERGAARRIADGGGPLWNGAGALDITPPQWSADSRWVYFRALRSGGVQIWRVSVEPATSAGHSPAGRAAEPITHDPADVEDFQVLGHGAIVYRTGAPRAAILKAEADEAASGVHIDKRIEVGQGLEHAAMINGRLAAQRLSGNWFARMGLLGDAPPRYVQVDQDGRSPQAATQDEIKSLTRPQAYTLLRAPVTGLGGRMARFDGQRAIRVAADANTGGPPSTQRFEGAIVNFVWRPGRSELLVTTMDPARRQTLWSWSLATNRLRRLIQSEGVLSDGGGSSFEPCAIDVHAAVCVAASPLDPPHLIQIDLDTGAERQLDRPLGPTSGPDGIQARTLTWTDTDGRKFGGVLMLPAGKPADHSLPLVVTYYECSGYVRGGTGDEWPMAPLAARGLATLCIDQTGDVSDPFDSVSRYAAALTGLHAIIDQLATAGVIDRQRVGMGGLSFGSETTMWIVTHSNLLSAASIASAQMEPAYYWFTGLSGQHPMLHRSWGLGDPDHTRPVWEQISPALKIDTIHTPLLMQLPEQEFRYTMELYTRLTEEKIPADMYAFPNEPHVLTQPAHRLAAYQRNVDWFLFWLKGEEDPDPVKREQYESWRAQRQAWTASPPAAVQPADQARSQSSTSASSNRR